MTGRDVPAGYRGSGARCTRRVAHAKSRAPTVPPAGRAALSRLRISVDSGQIAPPAIDALHELGWQWLQAGDPKSAERNFTAALRQSPGFLSVRGRSGIRGAGAQGQQGSGVPLRPGAHRQSRLRRPALAGRGEALLTLGQRDQALSSFEAAVAADPQLSALRSRIEVLRFRGLQDDVDAARKAAEAGRLAGRARDVRADDRGVARQSFSLSRAGDRRKARGQSRPRARRTRRKLPRSIRPSRGTSRPLERSTRPSPSSARRWTLTRPRSRSNRTTRSNRRSTTSSEAWRSRRCRTSTDRLRPRRPSRERSWRR